MQGIQLREVGQAQDITRPAAPPPLLPWVCSCAQTPKAKRVLKVVLRPGGGVRGTGDFPGVNQCGQPTVTRALLAPTQVLPFLQPRTAMCSRPPS